MLLSVMSVCSVFFPAFHWSPSIGKTRVTMVSVKTTESYEVADESYEVGRLGHHFGSTFTGTDRNGRALLPHRTRLCPINDGRT